MMSRGGHDLQAEPAKCIRAARARVAEITRQLSIPTAESTERCGDLLGEVGEQLQSAAAILQDLQGPHNAGFRRDVVQLHREVKTLAQTLAESDRLVSGWIRRVGVKHGGYTEQGASAPLVLVKRVNVEG